MYSLLADPVSTVTAVGRRRRLRVSCNVQSSASTPKRQRDPACNSQSANSADAKVGGSVPGSFCVDATDIFADPPAFPPFKLVERGEVRRDLEAVFLRQSRVPVNVHMDLRAAVSANRGAVDRIAALADRYGADAVKSVM